MATHEPPRYEVDGDLEKKAPAHADAVRSGSVPEQILKHAHDADEALKALEQHAGEVIHIDEATNKRLRKLIDWNLMPIMCTIYGLQYLDKTTLSYASSWACRPILILLGTTINGLVACSTSGRQAERLTLVKYLAWEYPTNRLLQSLPMGKYSATCIILWGLVLACFAAVKNFSGAVAIRFFLGVTEAAVTPGFAFLTSQWYTKSEQGLRTGIWFSFNGVAQIVGGVVAYGIAVGTANHPTSLAPWQLLFLATGLVTAAVGVIFLFTVPDNQMNARWLSKEDRVLALERIRVNQQGVGNKHFKMYQLREALTDPMVWGFALYALVSSIPNGGLTNFFSQLITSFGYTKQQSLLYGTPGGAVEIVALIATGYLGDRLGSRILTSAGGMLLAILGMALIVGLPLEGYNTTRLAGYYLTQASPTPFVCFLSLISSNVAGYTKKTTTAAMYLVAYCVGNIIGPQTFRPSDAPRYVSAEVTILVCYCACLVIMAFVYYWCRTQNAKKAAIRAQPGYEQLENQEWLDLTDRENPAFEYCL